ncbi:MAG: SDR family oxidoreductase [Desulfamplus sp.]|nr:SDR family oxidoreductase [Desulfamplus sp.]
MSKKKLLRQVISLKKIPFDALSLENGYQIAIETTKKVYIASGGCDNADLDNVSSDCDNDATGYNNVSDVSLNIALALQSEFSKSKINSEIIKIDDALNKDLSDMAGLVIIAGNNSSLLSNNDLHSELSENVNFINSTNAKEFLKKAFLLAKQSGKFLVKSCGFFATISFLDGSFGFGDENIDDSIQYDPIQGGLAGLVKTASLEWSGVLCKAIDLPSTSASPLTPLQRRGEYISQIVSLIFTRYSVDSALHGKVEIGIKDGFCIIPELINSPLPFFSDFPNSGSKNGVYFLLNNKDVIVITGGARGVTAECAVELASRFSPTIILIGRSPIPEPEPAWLNGIVSESDIKKAVLANINNISNTTSTTNTPPTPMELQKICKKIIANREITQNLERISAAGSVVQYYSVDIRNMEDVRKTLNDIREKFGKISGIVHGAGILEDKLIVDKSESQFEAVFSTKVDGMENLLNATFNNFAFYCAEINNIVTLQNGVTLNKQDNSYKYNDELKFVVFFSSVAARFGNLGQVDYSMANEVLNKTAQYYAKRQNNQCRFLSINWGPWEGGMVSPSLKNAFIKRGIELIPLKEGAESFVDELCMCLSKVDSSQIDASKTGSSYIEASQVEVSDIEVVIGASLLKDTVHNNTKENGVYVRENQSLSALFSKEQILEFAIGSPSKAFGEKYKEFDTDRQIARLPGPPYFFMDRVIKADAKPWEMVSGGWIEAEFDMPCDGWYFREGKTDFLPFCILLEIALQPCGWLAAYAGSALKSKERLFFRNLGGEAEIFQPVNRLEAEFITLTMRSKMTSVSHAGGLIIQNFLMEVLKGDEYIYKGKTNFGFFTAQALSNQTGIRNSELEYTPKLESQQLITQKLDEPYQNKLDDQEGMPAKALLMIDTIDLFLPDEGKYGKGFIKGSKIVNPDEWFFKAHFYQDPVCPGSLGVESFLQLIKFYALKIWKYDPYEYDLVLSPNRTHKWIYRGQIIPSCKRVEILAHIKDIVDNTHDIIDNKTARKIIADGLLYVDGLCIYQMEDFSVELVNTVVN